MFFSPSHTNTPTTPCDRIRYIGFIVIVTVIAVIVWTLDTRTLYALFLNNRPDADNRKRAQLFYSPLKHASINLVGNFCKHRCWFFFFYILQTIAPHRTADVFAEKHRYSIRTEILSKSIIVFRRQLYAPGYGNR